jgi:hypothetical protein
MTGLVPLVLLAVEGVTILAIRPLLSGTSLSGSCRSRLSH